MEKNNSQTCAFCMLEPETIDHNTDLTCQDQMNIKIYSQITDTDIFERIWIKVGPTDTLKVSMDT